MRVRFGDYCFDSDARTLQRGGTNVHLSPKAFDLLHALIAARPRALSKEELTARLWPDVVVVEANLPNLIGELRRALNDSATDAQTIRTVPRFGYAFAGSVSERALQASKVVFELRLGDREIRLQEGANPLGRDHDSVVHFRDRHVSRRHAQIVVSGDSAILEDLGSRHGTFVFTNRVDAPVKLTDGDRIILATELAGVFRVLTEPEATASAGSAAD